MNEIKEYTKHIDENENEYWLVRELQMIFEYTQWRRFESVINKSKVACDNSSFNNMEHFDNVVKMIEMPKNATKDVNNYKLSCYACYSIS